MRKQKNKGWCGWKSGKHYWSNLVVFDIHKIYENALQENNYWPKYILAVTFICVYVCILFSCSSYVKEMHMNFSSIISNILKHKYFQKNSEKNLEEIKKFGNARNPQVKRFFLFYLFIFFFLRKSIKCLKNTHS